MKRARVLLCPSERRSLDARGVQLHGLRYNAAATAAILTAAGATKCNVEVRYDPDDVSHVYVIDPTTKMSHEFDCLDRDGTVGRPVFVQLELNRVKAAKAAETNNDSTWVKDKAEFVGSGRLHPKLGGRRKSKSNPLRVAGYRLEGAIAARDAESAEAPSMSLVMTLPEVRDLPPRPEETKPTTSPTSNTLPLPDDQPYAQATPEETSQSSGTQTDSWDFKSPWRVGTFTDDGKE